MSVAVRPLIKGVDELGVARRHLEGFMTRIAGRSLPREGQTCRQWSYLSGRVALCIGQATRYFGEPWSSKSS
jgi:hypothetical protein